MGYPVGKQYIWTTNTSYIKLTQKLIENINVRCKAIKFLEKTLNSYLCDLESGNGSLDIIPETKATEEKNIEKLKFIKSKSCVPLMALSR